MKDQYMIIISFDAVSSEDIEILKTYPNFKELIKRGSWIKKVKSVYPTLTYPAHTSIVTGKYPKNHGVIDNTIFKMGDLKPNWYWYKKYINGSTLYDLAKEKGYTTCSLLWPVTARGNITYNLPEIFPVKSYHNQLVMSFLSGTLRFQLDLNNKFGKLRKGFKQPYLDNFVLESALYTIEKYAPNLMMIHFTDVDTNRHNFGYRNEIVDSALKRHDERLGKIINALKKKGIFEKSTIVALGDHSQLDVTHNIKLNSLFKENNLLEVNSKGEIVNYKAICKSLDGACYIYTNGEDEEVTIKKVIQLLKSLPIETILSKEEILKAGGDPKASLMIEGKSNYYFLDEFNGEIINKVLSCEVDNLPHRYKATHGYSPDKGNYTTFFIGAGVGFKEGIILENGHLINHGPTLGKILGLEFKNIDGQVIKEILNI